VSPIQYLDHKGQPFNSTKNRLLFMKSIFSTTNLFLVLRVCPHNVRQASNMRATVQVSSTNRLYSYLVGAVHIRHTHIHYHTHTHTHNLRTNKHIYTHTSIHVQTRTDIHADISTATTLVYVMCHEVAFCWTFSCMVCIFPCMETTPLRVTLGCVCACVYMCVYVCTYVCVCCHSSELEIPKTKHFYT